MDNSGKSKIHIVKLRVEQADCPLGIEEPQPAFSWGFHSETSCHGLKQTAYRIVVASRAERLAAEEQDMWDSGIVASNRHEHIRYTGAPLQAGARYVWKVMIWDGDRCASEWSDTVSWSMGLTDGWDAQWIGVTRKQASAWKRYVSDSYYRMPLLRKEFRLDASVSRAIAYVCGLGQHEFRINGEKVGDSVLEPGWTDYDKTCLYCAYDITELLHVGTNTAGVMLGNGFYHVEGNRYLKFRGNYGLPKAIVQVDIELSDGGKLHILSGADWQMGPGPLMFSCVYGGEDYDARLALDAWDLPGFSPPKDWSHAAMVTATDGKLRSYAYPPNKVMRSYSSTRIESPSPGVYVYDFGANFSGWPRIRLRGNAGAAVKLTPGEVMDADGRVDQTWTGSPYQFTYTLNGSGEEEWSPRFSYYGFRYVQVEGAIPVQFARDAEQGQVPVLLDMQGDMIYPDLEPAGQFESSRDDWNRLHEIILQAVLSNTKSVFTDCPHREKLGWLEQVHLMGPSICYNYRIPGLLEKIFADMREAQLDNGLVPDIAPEYTIFRGGFRDSPEWGSSLVIAPWYAYHWYGGDERLLERNYSAMKRYVEYLRSTAKGHLVQHGLGDWGDAGPNPGYPHHTPIPVTATAMLYIDSLILSRIAGILRFAEDEREYAALAEQVRIAFQQELYDPALKRYATGSQTSHATALALGLTAPEHERETLEQLIADLETRGHVITSGEVGHRFLLAALSDRGRSDVIVRMLEQKDEPYYRYQVENGATSLTEFWDGPTIGRSQNHFMMGHVEEWFYASLAGIRIDYEGKQDYPLVIEPYPAEGVEWVKAFHELTAGRVEVKWTQSHKGEFQLEVNVPVNTEAIVKLPQDESGQPREERIGSGLYHYTVKKVKR